MRCFAVLGPAGAGKTTLVERLAALEGGARRAEGRGGLVLTTFRFMGEDWTAIDAPGSVEALPEARAALTAADAAVIVAPADAEGAALAAPHFRAVEAADAPCVLFMNKVDEGRSRLRDAVEALQGYASRPIVLRQIPIREGGRVVGSVDLVSERAWRYREGGPSTLVEVPSDLVDRESEARAEMLEHLSEFDDALLEELIEDRQPATDQIYALCGRVLGEGRATPALMGAASHGNGAMRLMKALRHETPPVAALRARLAGDDDAPSAVSFHALHRRHVGRVIWLRALDEGVAAGAPLGGGNVGGLTEPGGEPRPAGPVETGAVVAAVKADHLEAPRRLRPDRQAPEPRWARSPEPMVLRRIVAEGERDEAKLSLALTKLAADDPGLAAAQDEETGALLLRAQGPMHLRRTLEALAEAYGVRASEKPADGRWRETVAKRATVHHRHRKQTGGAGQFADVKLTVRPNPRGAGFTFDETVKGGAVPRNYIPAVEAGARDALRAGPLGFPVVDVGVTLTDGQHHSVDSSDFAFRAAGRAAVAQALAEGGPTLLQPIHDVEIHAPSAYGGGLVTLVSSLKGRVLGFDRDPEARGWDLFRAQLPASALDELATALRATTQGVGWFVSGLDHFEEVYGREAERVVAARGSGVG